MSPTPELPAAAAAPPPPGAARRLARALRPEELVALAYALLAWAWLAARGLSVSIVAMAVEYGRFLGAMLAVALPLWLVALGWRAAHGRADRRAAGRDLVGLVRSFAMLLVVLVAYTNLKSRIALLHPRLFDAPLERLDAWVHFAGGDFVGWLLTFTHDSGRVASLVLTSTSSPGRRSRSPSASPSRAPAPPRPVASRPRSPTPTPPARSSTSRCRASAPPSPSVPASPTSPAPPATPSRIRCSRPTSGCSSTPSSGAVPFFGIAAMPSLHLATTALGVFAAWRWCRPLVWLLIPWNLAIAWSALYFGWHYAIDFYPGVALAWGGWWLAGKYGERD